MELPYRSESVGALADDDDLVGVITLYRRLIRQQIEGVVSKGYPLKDKNGN